MNVYDFRFQESNVQVIWKNFESIVEANLLNHEEHIFQKFRENQVGI